MNPPRRGQRKLAPAHSTEIDGDGRRIAAADELSSSAYTALRDRFGELEKEFAELRGQIAERDKHTATRLYVFVSVAIATSAVGGIVVAVLKWVWPVGVSVAAR